jgi:hypothetical protein
MTQNKFWLVWSPQGKEPPKKRYNSEESAVEAGKKLAESYPKQDVFVAPVTHHFKADVNVVETSLEQEVNHWLIDGEVIGINKDYILNETKEIVKIIACDHDSGVVIYKKKSGEIFEITLSENRLHREFSKTVLSEQILTPNFKFKVGDRVRWENVSGHYTNASISGIDDKKIECITDRNQTVIMTKEDIDLLELII